MSIQGSALFILILLSLIIVCINNIVSNNLWHIGNATPPASTVVASTNPGNASVLPYKPLSDKGLYVGFRASRYGITPFPDPTYWYAIGNDMSDKFEGSRISGIWVVGEAGDGRGCALNFPSSGKYDHISFSNEDMNEEYLNYFDEKGISIFLQVEPGDANVSDLIKLVLDKYSRHPCVAGFGIDVEWYKNKNQADGKQVSDEEASAWYSLIRSYNKYYTLFLKHWLKEKMPPTYREGIYFIDDSQGFSSLDEMTNEFITWGKRFPDNPVGFQIGYENDKVWWGNYKDPYSTIGHDLIKNINNIKGIYWVDFSIRDIYPKN